MLKTPSEAIVLKDKKGNIISIVTPYDDNNTLKNPINYVGEENKKTLKSLFKSFGNAYLQ
tara:strand:- start:813 stop:992 length:180 start_codon:yes stop_codon:yes gene_type:complete